MFEFEKQIMKAENRYPMVGYSYKVLPKSEFAKLCFAKFRAAPHRTIFIGEKKKFIEEHLNSVLSQDPFTGIVKFHADIDENQVEMLGRHIVLQNMGNSSVAGIEYSDPFGISKRYVFNPLIYDKDFTIEFGEKITYQQPKPLTFDDIKAL